MRLPIVAGPLRGRRWLAGSPGKLVRVVSGTYEPAQTALFSDLVRPGATVLDLGAHAGYYTLLFASLAGPRGEVWAFEPHPRNCEYLRRHVHINRLPNVQVVQAAAADQAGTQTFAEGSGSGTGRLAQTGSFAVRTERLDEFCAARDLHPTVMKVDIEGAELRALQGAREILRTSRPTLVLSTHGPEVHHACMRLLCELDYDLTPVTGADLDSTTELLARPR